MPIASTANLDFIARNPKLARRTVPLFPAVVACGLPETLEIANQAPFRTKSTCSVIFFLCMQTIKPCHQFRMNPTNNAKAFFATPTTKVDLQRGRPVFCLHGSVSFTFHTSASHLIHPNSGPQRRYASSQPLGVSTSASTHTMYGWAILGTPVHWLRRFTSCQCLQSLHSPLLTLKPLLLSPACSSTRAR